MWLDVDLSSMHCTVVMLKLEPWLLHESPHSILRAKDLDMALKPAQMYSTQQVKAIPCFRVSPTLASDSLDLRCSFANLDCWLVYTSSVQ